MSRVLPLLLVLVGGCWPFIPGSWEDYAPPPEDVELLGRVEWIRYVGDYWEDETSHGTALLGWYEEPTRSVTPLNLIASGEGCRLAPDLEAIFETFSDPGADQVVVHGPENDIVLDGHSGDNTYFTDSDVRAADISGGVEWDLDQETDYAGRLTAAPLFVLPPAPEYSGPDLATAIPPDILTKDLEYSWEVDQDDPKADWFVGQFQATNAEWDITETVICAVPYTDGSLKVPASIWETTPWGFYVIVGFGREAWTELGDDTSARTLSVRYDMGFAFNVE